MPNNKRPTAAHLERCPAGWTVHPPVADGGPPLGPVVTKVDALGLAFDRGWPVAGVPESEVEEARARLAADATLADLRPAGRTAVRVIMAGGTFEAAAAAARVNLSTLWRWRQRPAFRAALEAEARALQASAPPRLVALRESAAGRVAALLPSMAAADVIRLWAHLLDRTGFGVQASVALTTGAPAPTGPPSRADLLADLAALPADVVLEAAARLRGEPWPTPRPASGGSLLPGPRR